VGTAQPYPDGDLVLGGDDVFDVRLKVGEGLFHQLEALPPHLIPVLFAGLPGDVFDGFDTGLLHVISEFRGVLAAKKAGRGDDGGPAGTEQASLRAGSPRTD
jgi:hypothetical protein